MSFEAALEEWRGALGAANVDHDAATLRSAERATFATSSRIPAVIRPASREDVQACVRIARRHGVPVYPLSRGCNWGFGSRVPPADGCVVMELARMDRIRAFDESFGYVTVEAGVTIGMLHRFLEARGSRLRLPLVGVSPRASVVGNALERGAGAGPGGYRADNVCNLEVVLPDGSLLANSPAFETTAPLVRDLCGAGVDGLFFQSNLGIVTAMTLWLPSLGTHPQICYVGAEREEAFASLLDGLRALLLQGVVSPCFGLQNDYRNLAARQQYPWDAMGGAVPFPRSLLRRINATFGAHAWWSARWTGFIWLQGASAAHAAALRDVVADTLGSGAERLVFIADDDVRVIRWDRPCAEEKVRAAFSGIQATRDFSVLPAVGAARDAYWRKRAPAPPDPDPSRDGCGEVYSMPLVPLSGRDVGRVVQLLESIILERGFEPCINVIVINERCTYVAAQVFFDRDVPGEDDRALDCRRAANEALCALGYPTHRTDILDMDRVAAMNPLRSRFIAAVKHALDPDGVLSPGRYEQRR